LVLRIGDTIENSSNLQILGQSGALVELVFDSGSIRVKKTSRRGEEEKLESQYKKQKLTGSTYFSAALPRILRPWDGNSFEMEYIPGVTLGDYASTSSYLEWKSTVSSITELLAQSFRQSLIEPAPLFNQDAFQLKLEDLKINKGIGQLQNNLFDNSLKRIIEYSKGAPFRLGPNHGDLSFENILIHKNTSEMYLVDFLPSPVDSPMIDAARLLIDAEQGWWFSGTNPTSSELRAGLYLARNIKSTLFELGISRKEIYIFSCFAALRILPYTTNVVRRAKLLSVLDPEPLANH
jgi:hypothetical protein